MTGYENIIEKYLIENSEEYNMSYFEPSYVPDRIIHREEEIDIIMKNLSLIFKKMVPKNMFIFGKTGTGKTAVIKFIGRALESYQKEKIRFVYLNCQINDNSYSLLYSIGKSAGAEIPITGWSMDRLFNVVKDAVELYSAYFIIVLDEIDRYIKKNGDDILYSLSLMNSELKNSKIIIIGITNDVTIIENLDARVKSRLNEEKVVFPPYNQNEIYDILKDRIEMAKMKNYITDSALRYISAIAAQENGDARKAIDLLKTTLQIGIELKNIPVEEKHVNIAKSKMEYDAVAETIKSLPLHSKIVLLSIVFLKDYGTNNITTGEIYNAYRNLINFVNIPPLTSRRITDILSDLDMLGIVNAKVISMGRYGRSKIVDLMVSSGLIKSILLEEDQLKCLRDSMKKQSQLKI
ncbi:MAG: Cdc6/Cdc18 family protein [Thermoplasmata archaeon]